MDILIWAGIGFVVGTVAGPRIWNWVRGKIGLKLP